MPSLKIVKRLRKNEYSAIDEKFISERIVDMLFSIRNNPKSFGLNIYINNDIIDCLELSKENDGYLLNIRKVIVSIKERNKLYLSSMLDTHSFLNGGNTPSSKYLIELDKNYCYDKVDIEQVDKIIKYYLELIECSDVDIEDIKLILINR